MKVIHDYPPNYQKILAVFPEVAKETYVVFTYGDCIYNPAGKEMPEHLVKHEQVHVKQQQLYGFSPEEWWDQYLTNAPFRYLMELEAYRVEYRSFCKMYKDRNKQADFLYYIAGNLSSPLYGSLCSHSMAIKNIAV